MTTTREWTLPGITFTSLATPSLGTTELAVWWIRSEPGAGGQAHTLDREEIFTVVRGEVVATVGGRTQRASAGQAVTVPAGTLFALGNDRAEPAELVVCAPAGIQASMNGETVTPPWTQ
jgi:quercetin dioxygenase-like cupin family protein